MWFHIYVCYIGTKQCPVKYVRYCTLLGPRCGKGADILDLDWMLLHICSKTRFGLIRTGTGHDKKWMMFWLYSETHANLYEIEDLNGMYGDEVMYANLKKFQTLIEHVKIIRKRVTGGFNKLGLFRHCSIHCVSSVILDISSDIGLCGLCRPEVGENSL